MSKNRDHIEDARSTAPLASPSFTGTPTAPTATTGTKTTQVATTAFAADEAAKKSVAMAIALG